MFHSLLNKVNLFWKKLKVSYCWALAVSFFPELDFYTNSGLKLSSPQLIEYIRPILVPNQYIQFPERVLILVIMSNFHQF
ncbi:hypothetical protein B4U84_13290 [Westiellopsis prolifica IICB1]|nr:hypothetical protein B4U84_13290 [Westiellopsis prolifica IICB1]